MDAAAVASAECGGVTGGPAAEGCNRGGGWLGGGEDGGLEGGGLLEGGWEAVAVADSWAVKAEGG